MDSQLKTTLSLMGVKMKTIVPSVTGATLALAGALVSFGIHAAPPSVGQVDFAKGQVSAQHPNLGQRSLAAKASIYGQDTIATGDQSFSVLRFSDQGKVTVRPLSRFAVSSYSPKGTALRLDQGSLDVDSASRLVVNTKLAKVEARQAKLEVRICKQDCTLGSAAAADTKVVAKVVSKKGQVSANGRALDTGSALYESDRLSSGANSQMLAVFRDGGRVSLGANSEVNIKEFRYAQAGSDRSSLQLIKGSLRALTGQIGKSRPESYSIETPVATIGVRGTNFDLVYPVNVKGQRGAAQGLLSHVRQGAISQRNSSGNFGLTNGKVNYIASQQQAPQGLATPPTAMLQSLGLKPETARIDLEQMFGVPQDSGMASGIYVHVAAGQANFTGEMGASKGQTLSLSQGNSAFVDANGTMRMLDQPLASAVVAAMPQQVEAVLDQPEIPFLPEPEAIYMPSDHDTQYYYH